MTCRSGCPTQDHASYAECCRDSGLRVAYSQSSNGQDYSAQKRWDRELSEYRDLRRQGVQPDGTTRPALEHAKAMSDALGKPYVPL